MDPQHGPSQPDLIIGQTIGNYLVKQKLGEGGMGAVYLAEHPAIGKKVALKVLHSEFSANQDVTTRFFNEAKAVNDIGHPNIVDIVDFGIIQAGHRREQLVYFIMEYLAGSTLSQVIRTESPLPPERALAIAMQVADALAASHRCGIVHRDLKPDNIILIQRGRERDFVKLLDFGIAKLTSDRPGSHRTRTGIVMGTPAYMSPEQCEGRGNIDHRTDIYALGIVLYEMLIGRVPFVGEGYGEILVQHLTQPPVPLSQFRMMNAHVEAAVMKALEKRPDFRYPTMDEMIRALADPVGYVEAHGGVVGFRQRQLTPSNAPLPAARPSMQPRIVTPPPGSITTTPPGTGANLATPAPTTLGASVGAGAGAGNKKGFIILAGLVVAAAVAAIIVVVSQNKAVAPAADSGSDVVEQGSQDTPGSADSPGSGAQVAAVPTVGSGSETAPGSNAGSGPEPAAGSGSAASGHEPTIREPVKLPEPAIVPAKITLTTTPSGARIYVDGVEKGRTPAPFELNPSEQPIKIVLKASGYEDLVLKPLKINGDYSADFTLKKRKSHTTTISTDPKKGSGGSSDPNKGSGAKPPGKDDSGLMRPD